MVGKIWPCTVSFAKYCPILIDSAGGGTWDKVAEFYFSTSWIDTWDTEENSAKRFDQNNRNSSGLECFGAKLKIKKIHWCRIFFKTSHSRWDTGQTTKFSQNHMLWDMGWPNQSKWDSRLLHWLNILYTSSVQIDYKRNLSSPGSKRLSQAH
jgi:hypothetical protein